MRKAGVLLGIASIPSKYGIGCFSKEAYEFIDFLKRSGQSVWQVLPLGPTGYGDSPYQSFSSYAGNPYFISLEELVGEEVCKSFDFGDEGDYIDYGKLFENRFKALKIAYNNRSTNDAEYDKFKRENCFWLDDYALFMAIKTEMGNTAWYQWEDKLKHRDSDAIEEKRCVLADEIEFWKYIQFEFYTQWLRLKRYANSHGISIIGDIPIYTAYDSVDVWAAPHLFQLDENLCPTNVAGCPPDGFSKEGQLWGNPLYRWERHKEDGFKWWIKRLENCFKLYDAVRIDHFRGFDEYYSIPYGSKNAVKGEWLKAPGRELFREVYNVLGERDIIAEDLGFITNSVKELLSECGFPGMKVFEFAFDERDENGSDGYLPHNYPDNSVAYTATHDNEPVTSWFQAITEKERMMVRRYLCDYYTPDEKIALPIISRIMQSNAKTCVIPIQDYMCMGSEARINTPSTACGNWRWRLTSDALNDELSQRITALTKTYGRLVR